MQLGIGRAGDQQGVAVTADCRMGDRPALLVQRQRRLAVGIQQRGRDGLLVVRVADLVALLDHQDLTVIQAQHQTPAARHVLTDGGDTNAFGQRHGNLLEQLTTLEREEACLAVGAQMHGHLILFLDRQQQRFARLGQPGRRVRLARLDLGALEHRHDDLGEIEEDQRDRPQHGQTADGHVPARQVVFERANAAFALQGRGVEIQPLHIGISGHGLYVVHARNPAPAGCRVSQPAHCTAGL